MTEQLYLVAHKCRGELTFDVAVQTDIVMSDGPVWIMPTTGHRVYPFWAIKMENLHVLALQGPAFVRLMEAVPEIPEGHRDHYAINDKPFRPEKKKVTNLDFLDLEELGL